MVRTRRELSIFLSALKVFTRPNVRLEQYPSDGNTAGKLLWKAHLRGEMDNKTILDLGCGTGILGIGALLLGAKHVIFLDIDQKVQPLLEENIAFLEEHYEVPGTWEFICQDVRKLEVQQEDLIVISNPPFGTKIKHMDKVFLQQGLRVAPIMYSMHKTSTKAFLEAFARTEELLLDMEDVSFPLQNTMDKHKKRLERIEVTLVRYEKI